MSRLGSAFASACPSFSTASVETTSCSLLAGLRHSFSLVSFRSSSALPSGCFLSFCRGAAGIVSPSTIFGSPRGQPSPCSSMSRFSSLATRFRHCVCITLPQHSGSSSLSVFPSFMPFHSLNKTPNRVRELKMNGNHADFFNLQLWICQSFGSPRMKTTAIRTTPLLSCWHRYGPSGRGDGSLHGHPGAQSKCFLWI